jgi:hypothetical protein
MDVSRASASRHFVPAQNTSSSSSTGLPPRSRYCSPSFARTPGSTESCGLARGAVVRFDPWIAIPRCSG